MMPPLLRSSLKSTRCAAPVISLRPTTTTRRCWPIGKGKMKPHPEKGDGVLRTSGTNFKAPGDTKDVGGGRNAFDARQ